MSHLRPRWTGSYHTKEGFQVSKRETEGKQKGISKGEVKKQGDCAILCCRPIYIYVHNNCLNVVCS